MFLKVTFVNLSLSLAVVNNCVLFNLRSHREKSCFEELQHTHPCYAAFPVKSFLTKFMPIIISLPRFVKSSSTLTISMTIVDLGKVLTANSGQLLVLLKKNILS